MLYATLLSLLGGARKEMLELSEIDQPWHLVNETLAQLLHASSG
jgi:hypothetical protein